jgi:hypothetical protein
MNVARWALRNRTPRSRMNRPGDVTGHMLAVDDGYTVR